MLTLVHAPMSRSSNMLWLLEELGADYEIRTVSIARRDGSGGPDPDNPHPHKQVPALLHDGAVVTEQTAIATYLCDLYPDAAMSRPVGHPERGAFLSWLAYYSGVFEPAVMASFEGLTQTNPHRARVYEGMCRHVEGTLMRQDYLIGSTPSAPDILFAGALAWLRTAMPESATIDNYVARMVERPARARALALDSGGDGNDGRA